MLAMSKRSLSTHKHQTFKSSVPGVLNVSAALRNADDTGAKHQRRRHNAPARSTQTPAPHQRHRDRTRSMSQPPKSIGSSGLRSPTPTPAPPVVAPISVSADPPQLPLVEDTTDAVDLSLPALLSQPSGRIARARAQKQQRRAGPAASSHTANNDSAQPTAGVAQAQASGSAPVAKTRATRRNAKPKSKAKRQPDINNGSTTEPTVDQDKQAGNSSSSAKHPRAPRHAPKVNTTSDTGSIAGLGSPSGSRKRNRQLIVEDDLLEAMELDEPTRPSGVDESYFSLSDVEALRAATPPQVDAAPVVVPFAPATPPNAAFGKVRNPYSPPKNSTRPSSMGSMAALTSGTKTPQPAFLASPPSTPNRSFAAAVAGPFKNEGHRRTQSSGIIPTLPSLSSLSSFNSFTTSTSGTSATSLGSTGIGLGFGTPQAAAVVPTGAGSPFPSPRYAASTFQHSPKPDGLPKPRFLLNASGSFSGPNPFMTTVSGNVTPSPLGNFVVQPTAIDDRSSSPIHDESAIPLSSSWSGPLSTALFASASDPGILAGPVDPSFQSASPIGRSLIASASTPNVISTYGIVEEDSLMDVDMS